MAMKMEHILKRNGVEGEFWIYGECSQIQKRSTTRRMLAQSFWNSETVRVNTCRVWYVGKGGMGGMRVGPFSNLLITFFVIPLWTILQRKLNSLPHTPETRMSLAQT